MRKIVPLAILLMTSAAQPASAQDVDLATMRKVNNLNHEFIHCSMFYKATVACLGRPSDQAKQKLIEIYSEYSGEMFGHAAITGVALGMNQKMLDNRVDMAIDTIITETGGSCLNWSLIASKYLDMCNNLRESLNRKYQMLTK